VPNENTVRFNGVAASVLSSSATRLVAEVPEGATTGLITITNSNGSATSTGLFAVGSDAPVIASFSPVIGGPGAQVAIIGTNFDQVAASNTVKFNGQVAAVVSSTATSIIATVPTGATSGHISVTTSGGTAVSSGDFFVADPALVEVTDRMNPGESRTIPTAEGKRSLLIFDGIEGQRVSLTLTNVNVSVGLGDIRATVYAPDGSVLGFSFLEFSPFFIDAITLPVTGTYTIEIAADGQGSLTVNLHNVIDVAGAIAIDGPSAPLNITTPGQNARFTFTGSAGQRLILTIAGASLPITDLTLFDSLESSIVFSGVSGSGGLIRLGALPADQTYSIFIDPARFVAWTGSLTLTLTTQPADATSNITPGGASVTVTTTVAGQDARLTFDAEAGQLLTLRLLPVTIPVSDVFILNPDGTLLDQVTDVTTAGWETNLPSLPATGTYIIRVQPRGANTGSMTVALFVVSPVPITAGGPSVQVNFSAPNQRAKLSFTGSAGQRVFLEVPGMTVNGCNVRIFKPDDTELVFDFVSRNLLPEFVNTVTLPVTGLYTIDLQRDNPFTSGSLTLRLHDVAPDVTGTITIGGPTATVTISTSGQNAELTFNGAAGQTVTLHFTNNTIINSGIPVRCSAVRLIRPDGVFLFSNDVVCNLDAPPRTLPVAGIYKIRIDPFGALTGSVTVSVTSP